MARSYDIADLGPQDGEFVTDGVRRKINGNFQRVLQLMQIELPSQQSQALSATVVQVAEDYLSSKLPDIVSEAFDDSWPVGSVIVTATSSDPRLSRGTWQQIGGGSYVRAAGGGVGVMDTGGSDQVVLQPENIPAEAVSVPIVESEETDAAVKLTYGTEVMPVDVEPEYIALLFYRRIS